MELLREQEAARQTPATNAELAKVWAAWHACPADLTSHERAFVLTGFNGTDYLVPDELKAAFRELKKQFDFLPFGPEYHKALEAAQSWSDLANFACTTRSLHAERIQHQLVFREADDQAIGRVAIYRADKELSHDDPRWLEEQLPKLERIAHVQSRYLAYQKAREQALQRLDRLLYPPALLKKYGVERGEPVHWLRRAYGVPRPPDDIPRFVFIARTEALHLCSQERLDAFCASDLPKLSSEDRQRLYELALRPAPGKDSNLVPFICSVAGQWPHLHTFSVDSSPRLRGSGQAWHPKAKDARSDGRPTSRARYSHEASKRTLPARGANSPAFLALGDTCPVVYLPGGRGATSPRQSDRRSTATTPRLTFPLVSSPFCRRRRNGDGKFAARSEKVCPGLVMHQMNSAKQHEAKTGEDAFLDFAALKPRIPVCERTLRDWVRTGKIPSVKMPGSRRRLFFWRDVAAALRRHTQGG
jgi:hypothetical protein